MEFFLNLLRSVAYGIIEGVTEWLPISSTGHMILAEQVLKFSVRLHAGSRPRAW